MEYNNNDNRHSILDPCTYSFTCRKYARTYIMYSLDQHCATPLYGSSAEIGESECSV